MKHKRPSLFISICMYCVAVSFLIYEMGIQVAPSVMTRELMRDFSISAHALGLMVSAYFYTYAFMQIPTGLCYDHTGPRKLLSGAALICGFGMFLFAFTDSVFLAGLSRFIIGFGSAFAFVGATVTAARWFTHKQFPILLGITQLLAALGAIAGEVPLAYAVAHLGWRGTSILLGGIGCALAFVIFALLQDQPKQMGDQYHKIVPRETSLLRHLKQVVGNAQSWYLAIYAFSNWGPIVTFAALWGVPFLREQYQISDSLGALATMMVWLGVGIMSPVVGYISTHWCARRPLLILLALMGFCISLIVLYIPVPLALMFFLLFFLGAACTGQILTFAMVRHNMRPSVLGTAIGFNNTAVVLGGAILQPITGFIINTLWDGTLSSAGVPLYSPAAYKMALGVVPLLFVIGFLVSFLWIREPSRVHKEPFF